MRGDNIGRPKKTDVKPQADPNKRINITVDVETRDKLNLRLLYEQAMQKRRLTQGDIVRMALEDMEKQDKAQH